jgi:hypothetical protein
MDLSSWSVEHPYTCPAKTVTGQLPEPKETIEPVKPWNAGDETRYDFPWVGLETSLQWRFFRDSIEVLRERGNTVFVVVGPFNEHMMTEESLALYEQIKSGIEEWLRINNVPYYIPPTLPSEYYADASHPLGEGYKLMAEWIYGNKSFESAILDMD